MKHNPNSVLLLIVAGVMFWASAVPGRTNAIFADPNLEKVVRAALNKPTGVLTITDLSALTSLSASWCEIRSLFGLEAATNLYSLFLDGNSIETLTPLENMTRLSELGLTRNHISDLAPLSGLTKLGHLQLDYNPVVTVAPLCGLTNLTYLSMGGMSLTNVECFSCFTHLLTLLLGDNRIIDPTPLLSLTNLNWLSLGQNPIRDWAALAGFTNLSMLGVSGASLSNLNWLAALSGLNSLGLSGANVSDISPLAGLTNLSTLYITENPLTNCSVLAHLPRLEVLYLDADSITDLSFAADLPQLIILSLWRNHVADLTPLTGLTNLIQLEMGLNLVTNISGLDRLTNLQSVQLSRNLLDLTAGSKAMGVIETLQQNGASVDYQPQLQPPQILVRPQWVLPAGQRSWLTFEIVDGAYTEVQPPTVSARSLAPELIPEETFATTEPFHSVFYFWDLAVTPAVNKAGPATLIIAATNYAGLWTNIPIQIQVVPLVAFDGASLDSPALTWSSAGTPGWFGQNAISHDGVGAAQSGADNSFLQTTVTGPGTLRFWFKLESDYYYANGQLSAISQDSNLHLYEHLHRSGERWQEQIINLPAGEWVLKWSPSWDDWSFGGLNTLWLDQISFTPGPPACWLESVAYERPNGDREFHLHGSLGQTYEVQVSTDLRNWSKLTQVTCENLDTSFLDWKANTSARFYRTRALP